MSIAVMKTLGINKSPTQEVLKKRQFPEVFVIMPFSSDLDDIYFLGIREIARILGYSCLRTDEIEFVGDVRSKILDCISNCKVLIAEVTNKNPNVYYEVGYADALKKPVILITKHISSSTFDIIGLNHIIYKNIQDLREKLRNRLQALLNP